MFTFKNTSISFSLVHATLSVDCLKTKVAIYLFLEASLFQNLDVPEANNFNSTQSLESLAVFLAQKLLVL